MNYGKSRFQRIFDHLYLMLKANVLFLVGIVVSLFINPINAVSSVFYIIDLSLDEVKGPRLKTTREWWTYYKNNFKSNLVPSILYILVGVILSINISYLKVADGVINYFLFYISIFLFGVLVLSLVLYSFLYFKHPEEKRLELARNSFFYVVGYLIEMVILIVLLVAVALLFEKLGSGLLIFFFGGVVLYACYWAFLKLYQGVSLRSLFKDTRQ